MLFGEWLDEWLANYVEQNAKTRTYLHYLRICKNHIKPKLGGLLLEDITAYSLQRLVAELLRCGNLKNGGALSSNSVNSIITVIRLALKQAYDVGLTSAYVGDGIKRPRSVERRVECFTLAEQRRIEEYVINEDRSGRFFGVLLCLYTGLRIGELMALDWEDINLRESELYVTKNCYFEKGSDGRYGRRTDTPKTPSSERTVPLPASLLPYIREAKKKSRSPHVVSGSRGEVSVRSYQRSFSDLLARLGIRHRGFHSLRHTYATRAIECGMDVRSLSEILGHKSPTVTLNRYAHSLMEHKRAMVNRLGKLFPP